MALPLGQLFLGLSDQAYSWLMTNCYPGSVVNLALSWILDGNKNTTRQILFNRTSAAIAILAWSCSVIRSELALLLGPITIYLLLARRISIVNAIIAGFTGGAGGAVMSVLVDSYFWGRWTWPEMQAVVFNVVEGKSDEWGVSLWFRTAFDIARFTEIHSAHRYLRGTLMFLFICRNSLSSVYLSLSMHW